MALCAAHVVSHTTGGEFDEHSLFIPMALHTAQPPASEVEWQGAHAAAVAAALTVPGAEAIALPLLPYTLSTPTQPQLYLLLLLPITICLKQNCCALANSGLPEAVCCAGPSDQHRISLVFLGAARAEQHGCQLIPFFYCMLQASTWTLLPSHRSQANEHTETLYACNMLLRELDMTVYTHSNHALRHTVIDLNCCKIHALRLTVIGLDCCKNHALRLTVIGLDCCKSHALRLTVIDLDCCKIHALRLTVIGLDCCKSHALRHTVIGLDCCKSHALRHTVIGLDCCKSHALSHTVIDLNCCKIHALRHTVIGLDCCKSHALRHTVVDHITIPPPSGHWLRRLFHWAIYNKFMDRAMVAIILANTFVMFLVSASSTFPFG
eukprot:1158532-Pelagomonas_calceolata.AAC.14